MSLMKPASISGLNTSHAHYADIGAFLEFGVTNTDLVSSSALTTTAGTLTDDDIGPCRVFDATGDAVSQTLAISGAETIIVVAKIVGTHASATTDCEFLNYLSSTHKANLTLYNGSRFTAIFEGGNGGDINFNGTSFANQGALDAVRCYAIRHSPSGVLTSLDGVTGASSASTTGAWTETVAAAIMPTVGTVEIRLGAIIRIDALLTQEQMNALTLDPWAMLAVAPSLTVIDTDDILVDGQQDFTATVTNIPTGEVPLTARIGSTAGVGGTLLTGFSAAATGTPGTFICTMDLPSGIATGPGNVSSELTITYGVA